MSLFVDWLDDVEIFLVIAVWLTGIGCGSLAWLRRRPVPTSPLQSPGPLPRHFIALSPRPSRVRDRILKPKVAIRTHIIIGAVGTAALTYESVRQFLLESRPHHGLSFKALEQKSILVMIFHYAVEIAISLFCLYLLQQWLLAIYKISIAVDKRGA
nr:hypothetical protein [uncultured Lichenicoccus sp.]